VKLVAPTHRVVGPDAWRDANEKALSERTRRVTVRAPRRAVPSSSWLRYRSTHAPDVAASALLGYAPVEFDPPPGVDEDLLDDLGAEHDDWLDGQRLPGVWGGARLGGVPSWDQADETPTCEHGEMRLLLDYEGEQFLDGALHVFACPAHACALSFVAEF
jgi:hypothetical protein